MKPRLVHKEAMEFSFRAKEARTNGDFELSLEYYRKAANLESEVAQFYFDKPDLEPTRSVVIRSAAFLNLKAGLVEKAKEFIFFGLLNASDELIKSQLNDALEIAVSLGRFLPESNGSEFEYLNLLRQRSIHYTIEPSNLVFGNSVSLQMIRDFSDKYLKSLKAYAIAQIRQIKSINEEVIDSVVKDVSNAVNPLVTSSAYGSFKFSIANDFLHRDGEDPELFALKKNVISNYHTEIFINPLSDEFIMLIKEKYSADDIEAIFRPLANLKSPNSPYRIGYYNLEDFKKEFLDPIVNKQRKQLIYRTVTQEDIGELQNFIVHKRSSQSGKVTKETIFRQELKSGEFDIKTQEIEIKGRSPILLNEEISLSVSFDSDKGFTISFDDLRVEFTGVEYTKTLEGFYANFFEKLVQLGNKNELSPEESEEWEIARKLIVDLGAL